MRRVVLTTIVVCVGVITAIASNGDGPAPPTWSRTLSVPDNGTIWGLIAGGPGFVAVGSASGSAAIWTSPDAKIWTRVPHSDALFPPPSSVIEDVKFWNGALVGAGRGIWTSPDGLNWTKVTTNLEAGTHIFALAPADGQVVAVGAVETFFLRRATAWRSTDPTLQTWTRVFQDPNTELGTVMFDVAATTSSITASGGPAFVAAGFRTKWTYIAGVGHEDENSAIWTSAAGSSWSLLTDSDPVFKQAPDGPDVVRDHRLRAVMVQGGAIYVGGEDPGPSTAALSSLWRSTNNGVTWVRLTDSNPEDAPAFAQPHWIEALFNPTGVFGFGEVAVGLAGGDCAVWRGATGSPRWHRMTDPLFALPATQYCHTVGGANDILVVGGNDGSTPAIWTLARPDPE